MLLYHYAKQPFVVLKTRKARGEAGLPEVMEDDESSTFRHEIGPYSEHISFLFDPVPLDIIGDLFKRVHHSVWVSGTTIFEHVIDTGHLSKFKYSIVETPADVEFMNKNWPEGTELTIAAKKRYFVAKAALKTKLGDSGEGNSDFEKAAAQFVGSTRAAYITATKNASEESLMRYAANVPHVMLYPERGVVRLLKPARAVKIAKSSKGAPKWLNW